MRVRHASYDAPRTSAHPLRVYRVARGLTQAELAERAGIAAITVTRIENRQHQPYAATVAKLAHALGVEVGALVEGANPELPEGVAT